MEKTDKQNNEFGNTNGQTDAFPGPNTARWIHDKEEHPSYFGGIKRLPSCVCSNCGYHANREKPICPRCGAKMK